MVSYSNPFQHLLYVIRIEVIGFVDPIFEGAHIGDMEVPAFHALKYGSGREVSCDLLEKSYIALQIS